MKGIRIIIVILLLFVFLYPACVAGVCLPYTLYPAHALDSTPSAEIKTKLEALKQAIASKAAIIKQEINHKLQNKAYVGLVKTKSLSVIFTLLPSGIKFKS